MLAPDLAAPAVSVVVPTYQRRASVERLLGALAAQTLAPDRFEVIVVADGSSDGTAEMVAARPAPFALAAHWQPNAGRAAACNAGIALARGDVVVLLDDDMEPTPGLVEAHAAAHPPGSRLAVVGAAPMVVAADAPPVVRYVGRRFNRHLEALAAPGRRIGLRDFYSGNCSIPRAVLDEVGRFDERFRVYGNEDVDLGWRLRRAGVLLVFSAAAVARQHYTKDFAALMRDSRAKGHTAVLLTTKHPEARAESKLGDAGRGSRARRLTLAGLLAATRAWPASARAVPAAAAALGRLAPGAVDRAYGFAADFNFWLGVREAGGGRDVGRDMGREATRERERNALLRRADWRFLLPDPSPAAALCFATGPLRAAAAVAAHTVAAPDDDPDPRYDLAVVGGADATTLAAAFARLRPGGSCYVECAGVGARPATVSRRLRAAGFLGVRTYWAWPTVHRAYAWLPLDAPDVVAAYLDRDGSAPHGPVRRLVRRGRRRAMHWRGALGLTGYVGAVATRPDAATSEGFLETLRVRVAEVDGTRPAERRLAYVMLTGGGRSVSKVVLLAFAGGSREPAAVVKVARVSEAARGLAAEASMLDAVHALGGPAFEGVPRVLFRWQAADGRAVDGPVALGQTAATGLPITGALARARYDEVARRATRWLAELARASRGPGRPWAETSGELLREFTEAYRGTVDPALPAAIARRFAQVGPLPAVIEHRDFSPWNVFLDGDALAVLDWESGVACGVPGLDLVYFLTHLAFYRDGVLGSRGRPGVDAFRASYQAAWDPTTSSGRVNDACLREYAAAAGVDAASLPALRLLTWLVHTRSDYAHAVADAGGPPPPAVLRRGRFVNLVEAEVDLAAWPPRP